MENTPLDLEDLVNDKIKILELLRQEYPNVVLKKETYKESGHDLVVFYKTKCIFHNSTSKLPDLYFREDTNAFRCFGCGNMGNILTFVNMLKGEKYVSFLLEKIGIEPNKKNIDRYSPFLDEITFDRYLVEGCFDNAYLTGKAEMEDGSWGY